METDKCGRKDTGYGLIDTSVASADDVDMDIEERIDRLEAFAYEVRDRLTRIESRLESIAGQMATFATKADLADLKVDLLNLEIRLVKWFVGTAIALATLAFAAGRFLH